MLGMNSHIIRKLLVSISLFLLAGAAWGQSRIPASPAPNKQLQSDQEDVKPFPEGRQDLPLKDLREQPVGAQEAQAGSSLKKQQPVKPKSTVSRGKKSGAGKPTSGADRDRFALKTESDWRPPKPQPAPPSLSSPEVSLQQYLEQGATQEKDEPEEKAEGKGEESENLPRELRKLIKSKVSPQGNGLNED
jgi:hypothetical protein